MKSKFRIVIEVKEYSDSDGSWTEPHILDIQETWEIDSDCVYTYLDLNPDPILDWFDGLYEPGTYLADGYIDLDPLADNGYHYDVLECTWWKV